MHLWLLLGGAGLTIAIMLYSHYTDANYPYAVPLPTAARRWHNQPMHLWMGICAVVIEVGVYCALVRPWRPSPPWLGLVLALLIALPWSFVSALAGLHAGGVLLAHFLWTNALISLILAALATRAIEWWRSKAVGSRKAGA